MPEVTLVVIVFALLLFAELMLVVCTFVVDKDASVFSGIARVESEKSVKSILFVASVATSNPPSPQSFKRVRMLRKRHNTRATLLRPLELKIRLYKIKCRNYQTYCYYNKFHGNYD